MKKKAEVLNDIFHFRIVTNLRLNVFVRHLETEISLQIYQKTEIPLGNKLGLEGN